MAAAVRLVNYADLPIVLVATEMGTSSKSAIECGAAVWQQAGAKASTVYLPDRGLAGGRALRDGAARQRRLCENFHRARHDRFGGEEVEIDLDVDADGSIVGLARGSFLQSGSCRQPCGCGPRATPKRCATPFATRERRRISARKLQRMRSLAKPHDRTVEVLEELMRPTRRRRSSVPDNPIDRRRAKARRQLLLRRQGRSGNLSPDECSNRETPDASRALRCSRRAGRVLRCGERTGRRSRSAGCDVLRASCRGGRAACML